MTAKILPFRRREAPIRVEVIPPGGPYLGGTVEVEIQTAGYCRRCRELVADRWHWTYRGGRHVVTVPYADPV